MRAEPVAIHTALAAVESQDWIEIFTDSLSSLHAICHHNTSPGTPSVMHHHHHLWLLESIIVFLDTRRVMGRSTTLYKSRTRTNIRGSDLVDAADKLAANDFDSLPTTQTL